MLALALQNIVLVVMLLLFVHFLLKNFLLDKNTLPANVKPAEPKEVPAPLAPPADPEPEPPKAKEPEIPKEDPKSLDNLFKYILESSPPSTQPTNSNPLGFDEKMFSNIDAFEDESSNMAQYSAW